MSFFEQGETEHLQQRVERGTAAVAFFDDCNQHVDRDGDPDLGFDRVLRGSKEGLDAQVLLDPLEEQLDLPAHSVQLRNAQRRQRTLVGQQHEQQIVGGIVELHPPQALRIGRCAAAKQDSLIASYASALVDRARVGSPKTQIAIGTYHEKCAGLAQGVQAREIDKSAVHDVHTAGLRRNEVEQLHIAQLAVRYVYKTRDVAAQVQCRVQANGGLRRLVVGPGKQRQRQLDRARVQSVHGLLEVHRQGFLGVEPLSRFDQRVGKLLINPIVPPLVGIGQGAARNAAADSQVMQLVAVRTQAGLDIPKTLAIGQLRKGNRQKLIQVRKGQSRIADCTPRYTSPKRVQGQMIHELREHELALVHEGLPTLGSPHPPSNRVYCSSR